MKQRISAATYALATALTRAVVFTFARCEVVGRERLPARGPVILVANHVHLLDPPLIAACARRRVHPMAKRELFEVPLIGWFFLVYGAFPVRRFSADLAALRMARNYLRDGEVVLMFPEGTRANGSVASNRLRPALPGAAMVALLSRAPVVPVAMMGTSVALPAVFFQWLFRRRPRMRVEFGEPFQLAEARSDARAAEAATDGIMRRIAAMLPESHRGVYGAETAGTIVVLRQSQAGRPPAGAPAAPAGPPPDA